MSVRRTAPPVRVRSNVPSGLRLKMSPLAVVYQKRVADWYSIAVISAVVFDGISVHVMA